jgi:hypothetical protein
VEEVTINNFTASSAELFLRDGYNLTVTNNSTQQVIYNLSTGTETITGSNSTDYFTVDRIGEFTAADSINGAGGFDVLEFRGYNYAATTTDLTALNYENIEDLRLYGNNQDLPRQHRGSRRRDHSSEWQLYR